MLDAHENWTLADGVARLCAGELTARIDVAHPEFGLQDVRFHSLRIDGHLLNLSSGGAAAAWPARVADAYIRGHDLVTSYVGDASWQFAPQVYWSVVPQPDRGGVRAALAVVVSVQTDLLDTHPRIDVESCLPADDVLLVSIIGDDLLVDSHVDGTQSIDPRASACGVVWRMKGAAVSYAELAPTTDFRELAVERSSQALGARWQLFSDFLEKGVIRRARMQSLVVPRENDVQLVAEQCQAVGRRPLPLTT